MMPPTQHDGKSRHSSTRNRSRLSLVPVSRADQTNPLGMPEVAPAKLTFGQDFLLEHCLPGRQIASVRVSGKSPNPFQDLQESPQASGFPC